MAQGADAARDWMDEGDHLLARAYEHLAGAVTDPTQAAMAAEYFSQAAQTYVGGAVAHQSGDTSVAAPLPDMDTLTGQLSGRLRAEVVAAQHVPARSRSGGSSRAQAVAEALRDRLSSAIPESFSQPLHDAGARQPLGGRGR